VATRTDTPGGTVERFSELLEAGRLEALLDLYEDGAAFSWPRGPPLSGWDISLISD